MSETLFPYEAMTHDIVVSVLPMYLADQSDPDSERYVWAYRIRIENHGETTVQLISRHWIITDARGRREEVKGPGVVGEQPVLEPGEGFEYTSGCPLPTPSGFMVGTYQMATSDGGAFDIEIPAFSLDSPHSRGALN
jgi:ApaG protein